MTTGSPTAVPTAFLALTAQAWRTGNRPGLAMP